MFGEVHRALDAEEWILAELKTVLRHDASGINIGDSHGNDPLMRVLSDKKCSADIVQLLINYGAHVSGRKYLLHHFFYYISLCKNNMADVVKVLIKAGACTTHDSPSTLCFAMQYDLDADVIKVLLDAGLLNKCTHHSFLPLICATEHDREKPVSISVFRLLLEAGGNPNSTYHGETPLHRVLKSHLYRGHTMLGIIELLIESGAQIDAVDNSGNTPLHKAVTFYETLPRVVECLLKNGSSVDMRNDDGRTPLEVALRHQSNRDQWIIELLFSAGSTLGVKRHSVLQDVMAGNWGWIIEDALQTFFKYYFLEDDSISETAGLIAGHGYCDELSSVTSECARELKKMETVRVCNGRYSLLKCVRIFIRQQVVNFNSKIIEFGIYLLKVLSGQAFPLYFEVILCKVEWFFERKRLDEHLLYVEFSTFFMDRKIVLNYDCVKQVAEFLPKEDLISFIYSFYNIDCLMQDIEVNFDIEL